MAIRDILMSAASPSNVLFTATDVFSPFPYTGNDSSQTIVNNINLTGKGGLVWIKPRSGASGTNPHRIFDTVRGGGTYLDSGANTAEVPSGTIVPSFTSSGFNLDSSTYNESTTSFMSWTFREAAGFFDIVPYTGTGIAHTESHLLAVKPELIIVKSRSSATDWYVTGDVFAVTEDIILNSTAAKLTNAANRWNSTRPTVSVFSVGTGIQTNNSGTSYIAYLFASVAGISKIGNYTGNGSSQTINCGFSAGARFVLIKRTDSDGSWFMFDTARGIVTGNDPYVVANTSAAEVTTNDSVDPTASGFIVNQLAATNINVTSASYIFLAIA